MLNKTLILLLFISAVCFPADFFDYLKNYNTKLYNQEKKLITAFSVKNRWYEVSDVYYQLYKFRLGAEIDLNDFEDQINDVVDSIEDDEIKKITDYEKDLMISMLYGIKCYISSTDLSIGNLTDLRRSYKLSEEVKDKYEEDESLFGYALTNIVVALYFEDSFWIKDILGYEGNVSKSIMALDKLSQLDNLFSIEANIILNEYYSKIF